MARKIRISTSTHRRLKRIFMGFIPLVLIALFLVSCNAIVSIYEEREAKVNSLIVALDTTLYDSYKDTSSSKTIEAGTLVIKTGKCRESLAEEGKKMCPIKGVYSSKEGWVLEYTLVRFEDYLPAEGQ